MDVSRRGAFKAMSVGWLLMASFAVSVGSQAQTPGMTQARLGAFMASFDQSVAARDANGVLARISDRADIVLTMEDASGQRRRMRLSKAQYGQALQRSWAMASEYRYSRTPPSYELRGESAIVRSVVTETMRIQGQTMSMQTREETWVQMVDGQPQVVSVKGEVLR